jgi:hypothetical protein
MHSLVDSAFNHSYLLATITWHLMHVRRTVTAFPALVLEAPVRSSFAEEAGNWFVERFQLHLCGAFSPCFMS